MDLWEVYSILVVGSFVQYYVPWRECALCPNGYGTEHTPAGNNKHTLRATQRTHASMFSSARYTMNMVPVRWMTSSAYCGAALLGYWVGGRLQINAFVFLLYGFIDDVTCCITFMTSSSQYVYTTLNLLYFLHRRSSLISASTEVCTIGDYPTNTIHPIHRLFQQQQRRRSRNLCTPWLLPRWSRHDCTCNGILYLSRGARGEFANVEEATGAGEEDCSFGETQ